ncbi:MAG: regulatory protein RecX [Lysobacteraceae bacterium]
MSDDASKPTPSRRARPPASALSRAVGLLSRRDHSEKELRRKLAQRGLEAAEVDGALQRLQNLSLQSDDRFAENLLRSRVQSGHGPLHVRAELAQHGLDSARIGALFDAQDVDWNASALAFAQRRLNRQSADPRREAQRIANALLRRGFNMDQVRHALRGISDRAEDDMLE